MLSQQESWVFPVSHSSQVLCSNPTVKLFFLREGEGTGAQLPLLPLLNSLECQGISCPTNTPQPRHQQFLCRGSTTDPKTPLQCSNTAQSWNSTFYQLLFSTVVVTKPKISHRKVHRFTSSISSMRNIQFWKKKSKFSFRSNADAVTAQEPPRSPLKPSPAGNWEQRKVLGRTFPSGIFSCPSKGSHPMDPAC